MKKKFFGVNANFIIKILKFWRKLRKTLVEGKTKRKKTKHIRRKEEATLDPRDS